MEETNEVTNEVNTERHTITFRDQQYFVDELSDTSKRLIEHLIEIDKDIYIKQLEIEKNALAKEYISALLDKALSESQEVVSQEVVSE